LAIDRYLFGREILSADAWGW